MNQQIKWHELPNGYIVTDTYYQSGNKEFVSKKGWYTRAEDGFTTIDSFGTKHIQLMFANPTMSTDMGGNLAIYPDENSDTCVYLDNDKEYNKAKKYAEQGKDFFIYKVSEEKNV